MDERSRRSDCYGNEVGVENAAVVGERGDGGGDHNEATSKALSMNEGAKARKV